MAINSRRMDAKALGGQGAGCVRETFVEQCYACMHGAATICQEMK